MDNTETTEFIQALKTIHRQPGNLADMGLVIIEPTSEADIKLVVSELKPLVVTAEITYDEASSDEDVIKTIVESLKSNSWPLVYIQKDVGSEFLNQLQHLANSNNMQIYNFEGEEFFEITLPENSRVIIAANRQLIEETISYPNFYKLFGPILTI